MYLSSRFRISRDVYPDTVLTIGQNPIDIIGNEDQAANLSSKPDPGKGLYGQARPYTSG